MRLLSISTESSVNCPMKLFSRSKCAFLVLLDKGVSIHGTLLHTSIQILEIFITFCVNKGTISDQIWKPSMRSV